MKQVLDAERLHLHPQKITQPPPASFSPSRSYCEVGAPCGVLTSSSRKILRPNCSITAALADGRAKGRHQMPERSS